ncbi:MAG: zeta toxin family protein [Prevotellaceae bacterium]|jgi:predicted ABC-type ATPase|nr:zeta toxin family protein [Prevotellaceae bacterium]
MEKSKLFIVAGPNGSGKTSVTGQILEHTWIEGCKYINPDFIARDVFGDWNSNEAVIKAAQYAATQREECINNGDSFIFETVLSASEKIQFIEKARQKGYFIRLFFIGTDNPQINAARVASRVMEGGHDVPIQKIISRYSKSISNCAIIAPIVDRLYVYDNSMDNMPPKLLFRASQGKLVKQYNAINTWAMDIFRAVSLRN